MAWTPKVVTTVVDGDVQVLAVGHPLVDDYLAFLGARVRLNSWLAAAYDLKVFFCVIAKEPAEAGVPPLATRDRQWYASIRPDRFSKTTKRRSTD